MALRLVQLDETNRASFEALLAQAWRQNWEPDLARAILRWRYHDRPSGGGAWLACHDGECVAMLDSFVRPYLLDGRRILVREGCDWYCLPKYRPLGLGMRLMQKMMAGAEPMISIGGSETTQAVLPRLGWTRLPDVEKYVLPLTARGLAGALLRNRWPDRETYAKAVPGFVPLRRPRRASAPSGGVGRVVDWRPGRLAAVPLPQRPGLVQLLEEADQDWMAQMPSGLAETCGLVFLIDEAPVGFSLSQIEPTVAGLDGCVVHLQIASPDPAVGAWIVAETALRLAARGVGIIRCNTSNPDKAAALRRAGFVARGPLASYWWTKTREAPPATSDVGYLRADDAMPLAALRGRHIAASARRHPAPPVASHIPQVGQ
jgi:hypothetical protein